MINPRHVLVALRLPKPIPAALAQVKHIVSAMTNNAYFPTPTPSLATISSKVADVDAAQTVANTRAKGAATARNVKMKALVTDVRALCAYVQTVADGNEAQSAAIIESAGMSTRNAPARSKADLEASMGPGVGLVMLRAKAAARHAAYEFQYSADVGKTWIALPVTTLADTSVASLVVGSSYEFRVRSTVGRVASDWTQIITFLVH